LTNTYKHEKNYAFLPGFVIIIRLLELIFSPSITILIILIINKISTTLASSVLMNITILITGNHNLGKLTAIIFLFNPASIFYHAVYS
jgi:Gpi18-like mannosyltransferase